MDQGISQVIAAFLAMLGTIGSGYLIHSRSKLKAQLEQANVQIRHRSKNNSFTAIAASWEYIRGQIDHFVRTTKADRFLLLASNNGYLDPRWATAYVQIRDGQQDVFIYRDYEIDDDYRQRLAHIKTHNYAIYKVSQMPDGEIKRIYDREGVYESFWFYISTRQIPNSNIFEISYFSIATHEQDSFSDDEIQKFISFGNELRSLERQYMGEH